MIEEEASKRGSARHPLADHHASAADSEPMNTTRARKALLKHCLEAPRHIVRALPPKRCVSNGVPTPLG